MSDRIAITLTHEQILALRLMLRTMLSMRYVEATTQFKETENADPVLMATAILTITDSYNTIDWSLRLEDARCRDEHLDSADLRLDRDSFTALQNIVKLNFGAAAKESRPHQILVERISKSQPGLIDAFSRASRKEGDLVEVNMPRPTGLN